MPSTTLAKGFFFVKCRIAEYLVEHADSSCH
jgi:hypothetical protein